MVSKIMFQQPHTLSDQEMTASLRMSISTWRGQLTTTEKINLRVSVKQLIDLKKER